MSASHSIEQKIEGLVNEFLKEEESLFLVKVLLKGNPGNQKLLVFLDGDEGVTIDQCSALSRKLSAWLEEKDPIDGKFLLEISSAGTDFPLMSLRQYQKNVGRSLKVVLNDGSSLSGELKLVNNDLIVIEEKVKKMTENHEIKFKEIDKSTVIVSFK